MPCMYCMHELVARYAVCVESMQCQLWQLLRPLEWNDTGGQESERLYNWVKIPKERESLAKSGWFVGRDEEMLGGREKGEKLTEWHLQEMEISTVLVGSTDVPGANWLVIFKSGSSSFLSRIVWNVLFICERDGSLRWTSAATFAVASAPLVSQVHENFM